MPRVRFDKFAFFADLGYEPHPGQLEVHKSTALRRVVASAVRWGKSTCAAMEGLAAAMEPRERSMGWICSVTYDLADKVWREIMIVVAEHLRHRIVTLKEGERRLVLRNMAGGISEIRAKSADNPVSLLGEGLDWLIVDECARLRPVIWESHLTQRLIDKKGWAFLISTPKGKGWFYDLFRRGQGDDPNYESWNYPSSSNPHLDKALIEAERDRLPDRVFRQELLAEFLEGAGSVFRYVRESATGAFQNPIAGNVYYGGLDLAKVQDYTVLVILDANGKVVCVDRFQKLDWSIQVNRIKAATSRYNSAITLVDSTGAGEPVYESLRRAGCRAQPYPFTARSKAAIIDNLAQMLEERRLTLPKPDICPELVDELEAFEYSISDSGNVKTGAPYGVQDDAVIALALAAWNLKRRSGQFRVRSFATLDEYLDSR